MAEYNIIEKSIARFLNRFPNLKRELKKQYQYSNYLLFAKPNFEHKVHSDVTLYMPEDVFINESSNSELGQFFGYFDLTPWNTHMSHFMLHQYTESSLISVVVYSGQGSNTITSSRTWNFQQGCRAQWHPTLTNHLLVNDVVNNSTGAKLVDISGKLISSYQYPIQAVNPTGENYTSLNYERLDLHRPDYGYDTYNNSPLPSPDSDGVWLVDMDNGNSELVITLDDLIKEEIQVQDHRQHYINHIIYNPIGDRFIFMHRWESEDGRISRLYTSDLDGNYDLIMDEKIVSHYCWLNKKEVIVWGRSKQHGNGYHIIDTNTGKKEKIKQLDGYGDGHPSLSPNGRHIVTDTYPDRERKRHLLLYDRHEDTVTELGQFFEPLRFRGPARCDLHPRWSPDGKYISIDSAHTGTRKSYILDVSKIVVD